MNFRDLKQDDKFQFPKGIELREFGPKCPLHEHGGRQCSFIKTTTSPAPRSYFGGRFTNAKRTCDATTYDFSSVWNDVVKVD